MEYKVWKVNAEWWEVCGMRKVAVSVVGYRMAFPVPSAMLHINAFTQHCIRSE